MINDGDNPDKLNDALDGIDDDRLAVFHLQENRGRYFIDAVATRICPTKWWMPHDADDWSDPHRIESLIRAANSHTDVVFTPFINHHQDGKQKYRSIRHLGRSALRREYVTHMSQLWRVDFARPLMHPGMRVSWDGFATSAALLTGNVVILNEPTYHRVYRPGSLVTSRATGRGSPLRRSQRRHQRELWRTAIKAYRVAGNNQRAIHKVISNSIDSSVMDDVENQSTMLRSLLEA